MEPQQQKFPGFEDEPSEEVAENPPQDVDPAQRAASYAVRAATSSERERNPKSFPVDDDGYIQIDDLAPGMVDSRWGIITGKYVGDVEHDITRFPKNVPPKQRPIAAVRQYAKLVNSKTRAIRQGNQEDVDVAEDRIVDWLDWSLNPPTGRPLRKPLED